MDYFHKPWFLLPPQWAHNLSSLVLPAYSYFSGAGTPNWGSLTWRGLHFPNPLGIAGGVDKNGEHLKSWWNLGCGFVEVGTVTPQPQDPNPGKIMDRDPKLEALWNKMGFPSQGGEEVYYNLLALSGEYKTPVFVNIGKNRHTPNEKAATDYLALIDIFRPVADAFVVNISSPNTTGLRELQTKLHLQEFIRPLVTHAALENSKPLLVKLSPDMGDEALAATILDCADAGVHGFVLTNTTLTRPEGCHFPKEGGLSGAPLKNLSQRALEVANECLGNRRKDMLLVSVGGIQTPEDVFQRLQMGADLVQIYSALIFYGPSFFKDTARRNHVGRQPQQHI